MDESVVIKTVKVDIDFDTISRIAKLTIKHPESYRIWEDYAKDVTGDDWSIYRAHSMIGKAVVNDWYVDAVEAMIEKEESDIEKMVNESMDSLNECLKRDDEMSKYHDYIKSDAWKRKRQEYYSSNLYKNLKGSGKWNCYCCESHDKPLDLHHKTYKRLGNENIAVDLIPVCRDCHQEIHILEKSGLQLWDATKRVRRRIMRKRLK